MKCRAGLWLTGLALLSVFAQVESFAGEEVGIVASGEAISESMDWVGTINIELSIPEQAHGESIASLFDHTPQVDPVMLDAQRGGTDVVLNDIHSNGLVSGNQAYNLSTGSNSIADGAFVGANGLSTVVQNSGNNVLIQNSTIINIQLK